MSEPYQLSVEFRVSRGDFPPKRIILTHEWDFEKEGSLRASVILRQLRYCLISVLRTAAALHIFGWLGDDELHRAMEKMTDEEFRQQNKLSGTNVFVEDFEMAGPPP